MFGLVWGPTLAAVSVVLDNASDGGAVRRALDCLLLAARMAAFHQVGGGSRAWPALVLGLRVELWRGSSHCCNCARGWLRGPAPSALCLPPPPSPSPSSSPSLCALFSRASPLCLPRSPPWAGGRGGGLCRGRPLQVCGRAGAAQGRGGLRRVGQGARRAGDHVCHCKPVREEAAQRVVAACVTWLQRPASPALTPHLSSWPPSAAAATDA